MLEAPQFAPEVLQLTAAAFLQNKTGLCLYVEADAAANAATI